MKVQILGPGPFTSRLMGSLLMGSLLMGSTVACGSIPPPSTQLTDSKSAVKAAEVGGAPQDPQAELHYKRAKEQIAQAEQLIEQGENERAASILQRAEADAELALALAKQTEAEAEVKKARDAVDELKRRIRAPE